MTTDYLIVGSGLAGLMLCETLRKRGKSFMVITNSSQQASVVASGLYNPVVLKRLNKAWNAEKHLPIALTVYEELERLFNMKLDDRRPIYRVFHAVEEQNNWFLACDKPDLQPFLTPKVINNSNSNVSAPFGYGEVKSTGRVDTKLLLQQYQIFLKSRDAYAHETFDYESIIFTDDGINYNGIKSKYLLFAEGFGLTENPFFNSLPLEGTKGELLVIDAPELQLEVILKSSIFVIPIGPSRFLVGSTYAWKDYTNTPTEEAKITLLEKLKTLIRCPFEVVEHRAGIRPTVVDRRPLVGQHPIHQRLLILNGLGSRGVLMAPAMAKHLIDFIEEGIPLPKAVDINRFLT